MSDDVYKPWWVTSANPQQPAAPAEPEPVVEVAPDAIPDAPTKSRGRAATTTSTDGAAP